VKIAIVGGGGVRIPLLVNGLTGSDLPIDEIALFDHDVERLRAMLRVARRCSSVVHACDTARACVADASFVFFTIRVGGIAARAADEAESIAHGVAGQETVGPAGFAMAMRTIPRAVEYAQLVAAEAPHAWVISFTNPVGIVTQAMLDGSAARVIGICDTPTELFEDAAHAAGVSSAACRFDYFGLNHLGWLREIWCDGSPQLARVWDDDERLRGIYRAPLFEPAFLRRLRLLPTEYCFFYYEPERALRNMRAAGTTRGSVIATLDERLFAALARPDADERIVYEQYLAERSGGYMQLESGARAPIAPSPWAALTGYDKIALRVVRAIHFDSGDMIPLNVRNGASMPDLDAADVVEVPCEVGAAGAQPTVAGPMPASVRDLVQRVKAYERLTVRAATTRAADDVVRALASNPLVNDADLAARLAATLRLW